MQAIEITATIANDQMLTLDRPLPKGARGRVRLVVLFDESLQTDDDEMTWLRAAAKSSAFAFLRDPSEDLYSSADGEAIGNAL